MKIVAFTGAGMSKDSGLDTFRRGGTWDQMDVRDVAYVDRWWRSDEDRARMLDFYNRRRREVKAAQPNAGHLALAELEKAGHDVLIVTQNIDDLHERAGSTNVIHLHGEIMKVRPDGDEDTHLSWTEDLNLGDLHGGVQLRPHVVWFGEGLPRFEEAFALATQPGMDALLVIGTTLEVGPANLCALCTKAERVFLIDPDPPEFGLIDPGDRYGRTRAHPDVREIREGAVTGVPKVVRAMLAGRTKTG
ncbi:NAD-dependent deacylase [bacterium]|nr:MAG: NAD-dependent deacylase [bacterium]